ncbi:hypothetical protein QBC46DRAFT_275436, partial [Diplogelasinospora grovesii]
GCCMVCRFRRQECYHEVDDCPEQEDEVWDVIRGALEVMEQEMFVKRRFARFTGCFSCGMPQWLCQRWKVMDEDGGRFQRVRGGSYQYKGLLLQVYVGLMVRFREEAIKVVKEMMKEEGYARGWKQQYKWYGELITWSEL